MYRIWAATALLAIGLAVAAVGATSAGAFPGSISPQLPGVGPVSGIDGPPPQVEVFGGRSGMRPGGTTWVEVRCLTSTDSGCAGTLQLTRGGAGVASAPFVLAEGESQGVHARLSQVGRRMARRAGGVKLAATACAADSMGRSACDSAALTVRSGAN